MKIVGKQKKSVQAVWSFPWAIGPRGLLLLGCKGGLMGHDVSFRNCISRSRSVVTAGCNFATVWCIVNNMTVECEMRRC